MISRKNVLLVVALIFLVGCDKNSEEGAKGQEQKFVSGNSVPELPVRPEEMVKTWKSFEHEQGWHAQFPSTPASKSERVSFDDVPMMVDMTSATNEKLGAEYSVTSFAFNNGDPMLEEPAKMLEFQQKRLSSEVGGELETADRSDFSGHPAVDVRFGLEREGKPVVAFARLVLIDTIVYQVMVIAERNDKAPVSAFIKSFGVVRGPAADADGWKKVAPPKTMCQFRMPAAPITGTSEIALPDGVKLPASRYSQNTPDSGLAFAVTVATVGDSRLMDFAQRDLLMGFADQVARRVKGKVVATVEVKHQDHRGIEAAIKPNKGPGLVRSRIFAANQRVYVLEAVVLNPKDVTGESVEKFLRDFVFE